MAVLTDFLVLTVKIFRCIIHSLLQWIMKPPEKTVANEICLITGAASATGIGHLLALEFAQRRATLVLWDVDSEGNENTAREVRELGARAYTYTCDVSRREEVYAAAEKVRRDVGDVTILVNNASIISGKPILQCPDELLERTMKTNCHAHFWVGDPGSHLCIFMMHGAELLGLVPKWYVWGSATSVVPPSMNGGFAATYSAKQLITQVLREHRPAFHRTVKAFLPQMIRKGHGHIITIAGSLGFFATGCMEGYCASKFAVVGFHEALSHELKAKEVDGVKTTLVCPYYGDTGLSGCFGIRQELEAMLSPVHPGCFVKPAMQGILRNQHMICIPRVMYFALITKNLLPWDVQVLVQKFLGLDKYIPQKEANCTAGR